MANKSLRQQLHTSLYMSDTYLIDEKEITPPTAKDN